MIKRQETKEIPLGEAAKYLNTGLEQADPVRLRGLTQLTRVREAKAVQLQREQTRLQAKLGADHLRVKALDVKFKANTDLLTDLRWGVSRAGTPAVKAEADTWILHGYVRKQDRTGVPDLTVSLFDDKNRWIEQLGYACTDANGYFILKYKRDTVATEMAKEHLELSSNIREAQVTTGAAATTTGTAARGIFIHVTDAKKATLYIDQNSLEPKLGEVVYREIILDDEATGCTPPPGGSQPGPGRKPKSDQDKTDRYLGNSNTLELHDLKNVTPRCQIDEIKSDHRVHFSTQKEATAAGYDFCAYCFGKDKSKR